MYANLRVEIPGESEPVFAWRVATGPAGATLYLDAQDGDGDHPVEAGERFIEHPFTVAADF